MGMWYTMRFLRKERKHMWDYTEKVMDHFRHPRNVGALEHPDGKATVGSLA